MACAGGTVRSARRVALVSSTDMPLNYEKLKNWKVEDVPHRLTTRDTILYALGVGLGHDPLDERQLRFVYEEQLQPLPTMATMLACPWGWLYAADVGVTKIKAVHAEQGFRIERPLPVEAELIGSLHVTNVVDKGRDKGAIVYYERNVRDRKSGDLLCSLTASMFCRADGGFDGPAGTAKTPGAIPGREPDDICDLSTAPQAALIYRLSGDHNPLHAEPAVARAAGFGGPILHGLSTFGVVGHALLKTCCDYDPAKLVAMEARFSAPVYPGEAIRTEMWREQNVVLFRAKATDRDVVVLSNGRAEIAP